MNKKVLVLGGSGFLGSHVADALTEAGYEVRIYDRISSPHLKSMQQMIIGDLMDLTALTQAAENCDYLFNFAGIADIDAASHVPLETVKQNVLGNMHALEVARLAKVKRFVFASTVYVYSEKGSFYRASKQAAERFVETYHERYGLNYTILRYGSLYGPRADERNGIFRFLKEALEKHTITYAGKSDAMREYIHVTDAARLSVKVLEEEYVNRHLVLTGQERLSVQQLFRMIAEVLPHKVDIQFLEQNASAHYEMTPYAFNPKVGHKLVANDYVDLGQGLLDCLAQLHQQHHRSQHAEDDWLVVDDEAKA